MKIETKFNKGDTVFYMKDNKVKSSDITEIEIICSRQETKITYISHGKFTRYEHELFETKELLLDSL